MARISKQMKKILSMGLLATTATSIAPGYAFAMEESANIQTLELQSEKAEKSVLKMAVVTDLHVYPKEYLGNEGPNYQAYVNGDRKMLKESTAILDATIERLKKSDADIILVAGDLTKDSEVLAHEIVAEKLAELEEYGKQVFVTNGNHDINAPGAEKFAKVSGEVSDPDRQDKVEKIDGIKANKFEELYSQFGFDESATIANDPNSTSYVTKLAKGYRLIVMDTGTYGDDKSDQSTSGHLDNGRLEWILDQIEEAKKAGDTIIGMSHHGIVEHFDGQGDVFAPYLVKDYEDISTLLADAGMEYVFTGHFHAQDVATKTTEAGNTIIDIMTGSTVSYPSPIRFVEIDGSANKIDIKSERIKSIDGINQFEQYSEQTMRNGVPGMVSSLLSGILNDLVGSMFPNDDYLSEEGTLINKEINEILEKEVKVLLESNPDLAEELLGESGDLKNGKSTIEDIIDNLIKKIFTKEKLTNYINAVCKGLETVTINTSIAEDGKEYKFMDAITHCLMEVYAGDEEYSGDMKILKEELENDGLVQEALVKVLVANVNQLHTGNPIENGIINSVFTEANLNKIFDTEVSEETSIGDVLGKAFATLLNSILTDDTPDNEGVYIDGKIATKNVVDNKINEIESNIDRSKYTYSSLSILDEAVSYAKKVIENPNSSQDDIEEAMVRLCRAVNGLTIRTSGGGNIVGGEDTDSVVDFKDIDKHWAVDSINEFVKKGYIEGYEDGTFKPENAITRAEFAKIVNKVCGFTIKADVEFSDISSDAWYYDDIRIGGKAGYIDGYENNTFKPEQPITREEAAKIVAKVTEFRGDGVIGFKDAKDVSDWAKDYVDALSDNKVINGYEDNTFRPQNKITRAETVVILSRIKSDSL